MRSLKFIPCILFVLAACNQNEEEDPTPIADPKFVDFEIVKSVAWESEENTVFSKLVIDFNYPLESEVALGEENVKYRAVFEEISSRISGLPELNYAWSEDLTQLMIEPELNWPPDTDITFDIAAHWERFVEGEWQSRYQETFHASISVGSVPAILGEISIEEGARTSVFTRPRFSTQIDLNTKIGDFSPFVESAHLLNGNDTLPSTLEVVDHSGVFEIVPDAFLPESTDLKITIEANWKKNVDDRWVTITSSTAPLVESKEIAFESILEDITVDFFPRDKEQKVSVFYNPWVEFNYDLGVPLAVNPNVRPNYTLVKLEDGSGLELPANLAWDEKTRSMQLKMLDHLPENNMIQLIVDVRWEQLVGQTWETLGADYETKHEATFNTSALAESELVDVSKYAYSYPVPYQVNFLKGETGQGYIKLNEIDQATEDLIKNTPVIDLLAAFSNNANTYSREVALTYSAVEKQFTFGIPDDLLNSKVFRLELFGHDGVKSILLTRIYFATSAHNTLQEKVNALSIISGWRRSLRGGVHELGQTYLEGEVMDKAEIENGLISVEAVLDNNDYYHHQVYPLIYDGIERGELNLTWRNGSKYGIIPKNAMYIRQYPSDKEINYWDFINGNRPYITDLGAVIYNLVDIYERDYMDLKDQISSIPASERTEWMNNLMGSAFPTIQKGDYDYVMRYILPGTHVITSEIAMSVNNPLD